MHRVIHFELFAKEPDRASDFYSEIFGWLLTKKVAGKEDYWLISTGQGSERGINGGMKTRASGQTGMIPTIEVEDVDATLAKVETQGGKVVEPKKKIGGTGYLAYCSDTEGNLFAILQYAPEVKE